MSTILTPTKKLTSNGRRNATTEPILVRAGLTTLAVAIVVAFLIMPLIIVFNGAFQSGLQAYRDTFTDPGTRSSIVLTLVTAAICVPLNAVFGIAAAWLIAKFSFPGRNLLITLIDLPFAISPVVSGLIFVLVFGEHGIFGHFLSTHQIQIIFAVPGIILASLFVTFPYVARELLPLMQSQGTDEEMAAVVLGASGWQTFRRVTLPNIRWALLYGIILCNARAMGEFGAVSVVSGHIEGDSYSPGTMTMPLQVEYLYNDYNFVGAFAVASLLAMLALVTLVIKAGTERLAEGQKHEH